MKNQKCYFMKMSLRLISFLLSSILVLTNLGEKMTDEEVDELLKAVDTSSGEINYMGKFAPGCLIFPASSGNIHSLSLANDSFDCTAELVRTILAN